MFTKAPLLKFMEGLSSFQFLIKSTGFLRNFSHVFANILEHLYWDQYSLWKSDNPVQLMELNTEKNDPGILLSR